METSQVNTTKNTQDVGEKECLDGERPHICVSGQAQQKSDVQTRSGSCSAAQNGAYCSKEGDFCEEGNVPLAHEAMEKSEKIARNKRLLDPTVPLTTLVAQGKLSSSCVHVIKRARQIVESKREPFTPDGHRGLWIWGDVGTGKSRHVWDTYPDIYEKSADKWFDGYSGESTILLDNFNKKTLGRDLKQWMDRYPVRAETRGGTVQLRHERLIVISKYSIEQVFAGKPYMIDGIRLKCSVQHFSNKNQS